MAKLRGAVASPRHLMAAATPHIASAAPANFARLAPELSFWGNDRYGDCVSAEEAAARASESAGSVFVSDDDLIQWAGNHGYLNGANLTDVMDTAETDGIPADGSAWCDGPYNSVNWSDYPTLCSAIYNGPVKMGVAANQLDSPATPGVNGWWLKSASKDRNIDHSTGHHGYGTAEFCGDLFKVNLPSGVGINDPCVINFTWNSYGILLYPASTNISGEAWLRKTTISKTALPPRPTRRAALGLMELVNHADVVHHPPSHNREAACGILHDLFAEADALGIFHFDKSLPPAMLAVQLLADGAGAHAAAPGVVESLLAKYEKRWAAVKGK